MSTLNTAIALAVECHEGQVDKLGRPYILHPLRVMMRLDGDDDAMMVAVMHDIIEDTEMDADSLAFDYEFSDRVHQAVVALSRPGEDAPNRPTYKEYVRSLVNKPLARKVKIADLLDNMMPVRWKGMPKEFHGMLKRYEWALDLLTQAEADESMGEHPPLHAVPTEEVMDV